MIPFFRNMLSLKVDDPRFKMLNPEGRKFGTFEAVKNLPRNQQGEATGGLSGRCTLD